MSLYIYQYSIYYIPLILYIIRPTNNTDNIIFSYNIDYNSDNTSVLIILKNSVKSN
jgi:hypothetical protein